uniref:Tudor domain-containing protein n=1 Tax=Timema monikensis TaxID=170555 RepID=A0A7R9EC83_9NEOP|nr:unnamed protein product [Timema monikensis]
MTRWVLATEPAALTNGRRDREACLLTCSAANSVGNLQGHGVGSLRCVQWYTQAGLSQDSGVHYGVSEDILGGQEMEGGNIVTSSCPGSRGGYAYRPARHSSPGRFYWVVGRGEDFTRTHPCTLYRHVRWVWQCGAWSASRRLDVHLGFSEHVRLHQWFSFFVHDTTGVSAKRMRRIVTQLVDRSQLVQRSLPRWRESMAPQSSRQLLVWSVPTLAFLLSLLWYRRKKNSLRSDPGGTVSVASNISSPSRPEEESDLSKEAELIAFDAQINKSLHNGVVIPRSDNSQTIGTPEERIEPVKSNQVTAIAPKTSLVENKSKVDVVDTLTLSDQPDELHRFDSIDLLGESKITSLDTTASQKNILYCDLESPGDKINQLGLATQEIEDTNLSTLDLSSSSSHSDVSVRDLVSGGEEELVSVEGHSELLSLERSFVFSPALVDLVTESDSSPEVKERTVSSLAVCSSGKVTPVCSAPSSPGAGSDVLESSDRRGTVTGAVPVEEDEDSASSADSCSEATVMARKSSVDLAMERKTPDGAAALEHKLSALQLSGDDGGEQQASSSAEQARGERDSANHSPADVMLGSPAISNFSDVHSEGSSDSGKGCSDVATPPSRTPASGSSVAGDLPIPSVYEFVLPQFLVGRLIGRHGTFVHQIKEKTNASILIKRHPDTTKFKICAVEGLQMDIEGALEMIRQKFPLKKYPNITLEQVCFMPTGPIIPILPEFLQLQLLEGVSNDVYLSSLVSTTHFFLQQPLHPTFPALNGLNACMNICYSEPTVPPLPSPVNVSVICVAPTMGGWYRAMVVSVDEENDTCDVKFVDYGGYQTVENSALRQIRSDFMMLPFQATECYLANVSPVGGVEAEWSKESLIAMEELTHGQMLQAQLCGYSDDGVPVVYLYSIQGTQVVFVNYELVNRGLAQWVEAGVETEVPAEA